MQNFPHKIFHRHAVNKTRTRYGRLYIFDPQLSTEHCLGMLSGQLTPVQISSGSSSTVQIYNNWVKKTSGRKTLKNMKILYGRAHPLRGHVGIVGEAINTLVANQLNFPTHQLGGACINFLTGETQIFFSRITAGVALRNLFNAADDSAKTLATEIIDLLIPALDCGILHADSNTNNIFYDTQKRQLSYIDLEVAVKINCKKYIAAAIMLSRFYDRHLQTIFTPSEFLLLLQKTLPTHFKPNEIRDLLATFNLYQGRKLSHSESKERLKLVAAGEHAALCHLLQK